MIHRTFLPDYAMYHIKITPHNIICKRTYQDFVDLKKHLERLFPCLKLPYLESSSWLAENDILLINKNKTLLEMFLRGLLEHPTFAKAPLLKLFLTVPEHKSMLKEL